MTIDSPDRTFVTPEITLRTASGDDLAAIVAILEAAHLPAREIEPIIDDFVVAEWQGRVVACGAAEIHGDTAVIRSVAVDESVRGSGIGRKLSFRLIANALGRGCTDLYLFTADAHPFWLKLGFSDISLEDWRPPARRSWQWRYVSANPEFARSIGLHTMWMPA